MSSPSIVSWILAAAVFWPAAAGAAVLATEQILMPLTPANPRANAQIVPAGAVDPSKPMWVSYKLVAVSAADKPSGAIVLDVGFEGVPTPITESKVLFDAGKLTRSASAGTIGQRLQEQAGQRTPQQLLEVFGPDLYASYQALNQKRGSILQGTVLRQHPAPGKTAPRLLVSVDRASGMQPVLVQVTLGQGDVPPEHRAGAESSGGMSTASKFGAALALPALGLFVWLRRRR